MLYHTALSISSALTLHLTADDNSLLRLDFAARPLLPASAAENHILQKAVQELREYFQGRRQTFTVPIRFNGTKFQQQVWQALRQIPYGTTCSYKELAASIGSPGASRAVGSACHCNPLPVIIPCHRVVGSSGKLTGYAGGLKLKKQLLQLEKTAACKTLTAKP